MLDKIWRRTALLTATALVALAVGCDSGSEPSGDDKGAQTASAKGKGDPTKAEGPTGKEDAPPGSPTTDAEGEGDEALDGFDPKVVKAATLARDIEAKPEDADQILATAALDRAALDAMMVEIAKDPALTEQYRVARGL